MRRQAQFSLILIGGLTLVIMLSVLLPVVAMLNRPWPGFFYSPFYTVNSFTRPDLTGWQAGVRPEQRLIYVGPQREPLYDLPDRIQQAAQKNTKIELFFEVGPFLPSVELPVTPLEIGWWLEKGGPLIIAGVMLVGLALRQILASPKRTRQAVSLQILGKAKQVGSEVKQGLGGSKVNEPKLNSFGSQPGWLIGFEVLAGWALITAPDYFLGSGVGLESGFDAVARLQSGDWLAASGKWSTYVYWLLWLGAVGGGMTFALSKLKAGRSWFYGLGGLVAIGVGHYMIACLTTAHYNNPNYQTQSVREAFWLMWPGLSVLLGLALWYNRAQLAARWLIISVISWGLFVIGWVIPSVFNLVLPGLGLQWYALALPVAVWAYWRAESQPSSLMVAG